jgi:DNA polymerase-4
VESATKHDSPLPRGAVLRKGAWFDRLRKPMVLHVDVDAFFASVEQLLIPALRGRPVAVGNGVIASCSYEARALGLQAGTPLHEARKRCPRIVILDGNYQVYRCFAQHIWRICRDYTCGLETFLDEAYGDVTGMEAFHGSGLQLARSLQQRVRREVGLPVSAGVAPNRMLAKIVSSAAKPDGVAALRPGEEMEYLAPLPIGKIPGVGPKTAQQLGQLNIRTVREFRSLSRSVLQEMFGLRGQVLYERARGRDVQEVRSQTLPKSISRETTFHQPTSDLREIRAMLCYLLERAMRTARGQRLQVGCVELSLCYEDWKRRVARHCLPEPADCDQDVQPHVDRLCGRLHTRRVSLRHVGVVLSRLSPAAGPKLFEPESRHRCRRLHGAVDDIRDRWGHAAIVTGRSAHLLKLLPRNDYGFILRTPSLTK